MASSMLDVQRDAVLQSIRDATRGEWKILVVDEASWKLILNVVKEDEILNEKIMNIEHIEQRRPMSKDTDAIFLLTPEPHIVDCVMADFERRRYRRVSLLWTALLHASLRARIDGSRVAQEQLMQFQVVDIGFYPRESNVVVFRDPWSFPILFHPGLDNLVSKHIASLAQKIVSVCVSLGEYPNIRYYNPRDASHAASVLCQHLARFVQNELDMYATYHTDFPPASPRPRSVLYIVDRSMDLMSPLLHEFTYQAMIHDLLPIRDGDKTTYRITTNEGRENQEDKEAEITEKDKIWVANRHRHMKDCIDRLMGDFQKFMDENPHFTNADANSSNSLNAIKDMLAGLPQFQEMKEAYSLHLTMAQESMNLFQLRKLGDLASVEQSLATGLDEEYKKAKNMADQVVRMLDEDDVIPPDRLRLLLLYLLHRDGLLPADVTKLLAHAQLPPKHEEIIRNFAHLGVNTTRTLKDTRPSALPVFGPSGNTAVKAQHPPLPPTAYGANTASASQEEYSLSRFVPGLKYLLHHHCSGTLDQTLFPYTKPQLDTPDGPSGGIAPGSDDLSHASLRSRAKPTWTQSRSAQSVQHKKPHQRVLAFVAGGATYSEARACYEVSAETRDKDVYLITSHMLTPSLFVRQVGDLNNDPKRLGIPALNPPKKAPAHLFEAEPPPPPQKAQPPPPLQQQQPPTAQMAGMSLGAQNGGPRPYSSGAASAASSTGQSAREYYQSDPKRKMNVKNLFKK